MNEPRPRAIACYQMGYKIRMLNGTATVTKRNRAEILFTTTYTGEPDHDIAREVLRQMNQPQLTIFSGE